MFKELKNMFEKRKTDLIYLLKHQKDEIDLSRQHQVYGAVKEIELFLESIRYFEESHKKDEFEDLILPEPTKRESFLKRMRNKMLE